MASATLVHGYVGCRDLILETKYSLVGTQRHPADLTHTLWLFNIAMEHCQVIYLSKAFIFHRYVKLPERIHEITVHFLMIVR